MRKASRSSGRDKRKINRGRPGRVIWVKRPGEIKRVLMTFLGCTTLVATGVVQMGNLTGVAHAEELPDPRPVYTLNEPGDFMITRVVPSSSYFEWTYTRKNPGADGGRMPVYVNAWYGSLTDYELYNLREGDAEGSDKQLIYKSTVDELTYSIFVEGSHMPVWEGRMAEGANLMQNDTHQIDYAVVYDNGEVERLRANYGRCVTSTPFVDGWAYECLLEETPDGRMQYQPYTAAGQRLEIPEKEDAQLVAADIAWRAMPGWPGDDSGEGVGEDNGGESGAGESVSREDAGGSAENASESLGSTSATESASESLESTGAIENVSESLESISATEGASETTDQIADVDDGFWALVALRGDGGDYMTGSDYAMESGTDSTGENMANKEENTELNKKVDQTTDSDGDDVGIPDLGKEVGQRAINFWQPILYIVMATAAIFGWWLLFFGKKRKNNKEKGEKR